MFGLGVGTTIALVMCVVTIFTIVIDRIYKPNANQDVLIAEMKGKINQNCGAIDRIESDIKEIKNNHLSHIWIEIGKISKTVIRIEEKLKK